MDGRVARVEEPRAHERAHVAPRRLGEHLQEVARVRIPAVEAAEVGAPGGGVRLRADQVPKGIEDFGRLVVGDRVHHLVRIVHAFAHDAPRDAALLFGEGPARPAQEAHLLRAHERRTEFPREERALHVDRVRLVEPHVEDALHRHAAAAVAVLELVRDDAVRVDEPTVGGHLVHERRLRDDRRVARVLHAAEQGLLHADRAVGLEGVFEARERVLEEDGPLQDLHRDARAVAVTRRHEVFELHRLPRVRVGHGVRQDLPRPRAREEEVRRHRAAHFVDAAAAAAHHHVLHEVAVGDEVRVARVTLQRRAERAFRRAVVDDRQDALEPVLLALAHVLLRRMRGRDVPVDALKARVVGMGDMRDLHGERLARRIRAVQWIDGLRAVHVERDLPQGFARAHVQRPFGLHAVLEEPDRHFHMLQLRRRPPEVAPPVFPVHHHQPF